MKTKKLALLEIFILVLGIIAIGVIIGESIGVVSAAGRCTTADDCSPYGSTGWECIDNRCVTKCDNAEGQCKDINGYECSTGFQDTWCPTEGANMKCCTGEIQEKEGPGSSSNNDLLVAIASGAGAIGGINSITNFVGGLSVPTDKISGTEGIIGPEPLPADFFEGINEGSKFSKMTAFLVSQELTVGNVIANAGFAVAVGYLSYYIGRWAGLSEEQASGLGIAAGVGYGIGYFGSALASKLGVISLATGWGFGLIGLIGAGVAVLGYLTFKKRQGIAPVLFNCYAWSPESGGQRCEECNNLDVPCNEYQCQSLGRGCELIRDPTSENYGLCVWKNPNDFSWPVLKPWEEALLDDFEYIPNNQVSPPDKGVFINYIGDEIVERGKQNTRCIPPFSVLRFGIESNESAQCKISIESGQDFEDMQDTFLSNARDLYNHTILLKHKSRELEEAEVQQLLKDLEEEGENVNIDDLELENDAEYQYYVKCEDHNGNSNPDEFIFEFCVSDFDGTAPFIEWVNPLNGNPIANGQKNQKVILSVNEPSDCKWSRNDKSFEDMEESFDCNNKDYTVENANLVYNCHTTLTGLQDNQENDFYFRCKDKPNEIYGILYEDEIVPESERNVMSESYKYTLIGTENLSIEWATPNDTTIKDSTNIITVKIEAQTAIGYNEGESRCLLSKTGEEGTYIQFANTNSYLHSQELDFEEGDYEYFIRCIDLGGNADETKINFKVETDTQSPIVVRAFKEVDSLVIVTNENAECVYSNFGCTYLYKDGTSMITPNGIKHNTNWNIESDFYVKCKDEYGNLPDSDKCSIIAKPFEIFEQSDSVDISR